MTETFAFLWQHLLQHEPEGGVRLLEAITKGRVKLKPEEAKSVALKTQVVLSEGMPDLEIRTPDHLVYLEVKVESEVRRDQLLKYRRFLEQSGVPSTSLVLMTRYSVLDPECLKIPDALIRWRQVAEWIDQERSRYKFQAVSAFLVEQFLGFLQVRNMIMGQVTWEFSGGVRALRSLATMLYEAATACGCLAQIRGSQDSMGVYLDKNKYWLGVSYDRPEILSFSTHYANVDKEAAARVGLEGVFEWTSEPGHGWRRDLDLESEEIHFFARSKASQMQLLESFLRECLDTVKSIELRETKAAPSQSKPESHGEEPSGAPLPK